MENDLELFSNLFDGEPLWVKQEEKPQDKKPATGGFKGWGKKN